MARPELVVLDVNETLSDTAPLRERFAEVGLAPHEAEPWFAGVLRDAFALTVVGENPAFADLAAEGVRTRLPADHPDPDGAAAAVLDAFTSLAVHADVVDGLRALRDGGSRLVTLSNGSASIAEGLLERAGALDLVEACLSVADAPAWKPDARAYAHALAHTGVDAGDAMLVAVHPWDVDGAARAGLRTAWLRRGVAHYPAYARSADVVADDLRDLARRLAG
ncbi:haloacid dehalogenase type II [Nocardioides perillae]|uniref:2-haloacid dehalogenase n=1 Tax=Nocardioides perillae TaxID=1119534 RepID=A0A7Y9RVM1_9ACTN|nr:2-haloacid dehalogenase [Nocardioides perillae]